MAALAQDIVPTSEVGSKYDLKELSPKHKQVCSMLAQGHDRATIAAVIGITPEYISMLAKQPLVQAYVRDMSAVANLQLEAMFTSAVTAIGDTLQNGNYSDKVKAARLQLEATKRVGSSGSLIHEVVDSNARLAKLAERLLYLQGHQGQASVEVEEGEFSVAPVFPADCSEASGLPQVSAAEAAAAVALPAEGRNDAPSPSEDI
jgi:hypothetical protein